MRTLDFSAPVPDVTQIPLHPLLSGGTIEPIEQPAREIPDLDANLGFEVVSGN